MAGSMTFTPNANSTYLRGLLDYDSGNECLRFFNNETEVALQIGQEFWVRVYNNSGSTITNGSLVYITGTDAGTSLPTIALAKADNPTTASVAGFSTHSIENNTIGFVTSNGAVNGLDTSGFAAGAILYLSAATAGLATSTQPVAPNVITRVGTVSKSNASTGVINATIGGVGLRTRRSLNSLTANTSTTGAITEVVLVTTISIPANSLGANDALQVQSLLFSTGTANTKTFRFYIGPTNGTTAGATLIGTFQMTSATLTSGFARRICNKNSQTTNNAFPTATSAASEDATSTVARTATNINFAVAQFLIITVQLANAADAGGVDNLQLYINQA
jgi:hypothetical protein